MLKKLTGLILGVQLGLMITGCSTTKKFDDDSLLYLEEVEGPKALEWVRAQNEISLQRLQSDPLYPKFFNQTKKILTASDRIPFGKIRGRWVYNFWQDTAHVRGIWRRTSLSEYQKPNPNWDTLIDFDKLAKEENENWVYKGVSCLAPDYQRCLLFLSRGGKDAKVVREFDINRKAFVKDGFVLPEAKSSVDWLNENEIFVATDWGEGSLTESGYPRIVKKWKRGTLLSSAEVIFEAEEDSIGAGAFSILRPEGELHFISESLTFYTSDFYLLSSNQLLKLPIPQDAEILNVFKNQIIMKLRSGWRVKQANETVEFAQGDLVSFSVNEFLKTAKLGDVKRVFSPSSTMAVQELEAGRESLYISYLDEVTGKVLDVKFENERWVTKPVPIENQGTVNLISADPFTHLSLVTYESYTEPTKLLLLNSKSNSLKVIQRLPARFSSSGLEVEKAFAKSKDGTLVPYFLIKKKSAPLNGKLPTLLYGYGGFEVSLTPFYSAAIGKNWLERGGAFVVANIRGGGEFGPSWHQAALKSNRQKAFDDFLAVAEELIARKVTSPAHLGIQGGSNGGLLVGAAFTQKPELFNAVICQVPLLDMLRFHMLLAGASWKGEYGDPEVSSEKKFIKAYSPFQNLKEDREYPEVLFITSTKDDRVHPGHARKMAAKMEAFKKPFLYYENIEGGHSASANLIQRAQMSALEMVYLSRKLQLTP